MTELLPCKIEGCTETSLVNKGRWARLCGTHKEIEQEKSRLTGSTRYKEPTSSITHAAKRLVKVAERIDETSKQHRLIKNQIIVDVHTFNQILEEIKLSLKSILANDAN